MGDEEELGVCAAQTKGLTEAEAKAVGGRYAAARRREASVEKLVAVYRRLVAEGSEPSRAAVAEEAGLCVRTAEKELEAGSRYWPRYSRDGERENADDGGHSMTGVLRLITG